MCFFGQIFPKTVYFPPKAQQLNITTELSTPELVKYQVKQTFLMFGYKLPQKDISSLKENK